MSDILFKAIIVVVALAAAGSARYIMKMKDDNQIEQVAEAVIKDQTGFTLDLSPENTQAPE